MGTTSRLFLLLLLSIPRSLQSQSDHPAGQRGDWDLGRLQSGREYPTTIQVRNELCRGKQTFTVTLDNAPWLKLIDLGAVARIDLGETTTLDAIVDLRGVARGEYQGRILFQCVTCPSSCREPTRETRVRLEVEGPQPTDRPFQVWDLGTLEPGQTQQAGLKFTNLECDGRFSFRATVAANSWLHSAEPSVLDLERGQEGSFGFMVDPRDFNAGLHDTAIDITCPACPSECFPGRSIEALIAIDPDVSVIIDQDARACGRGEWKVEIRTQYGTLDMHQRNLFAKDFRWQLRRRSLGTWIDVLAQAYREPGRAALTKEEKNLQSITQINVAYDSADRSITPSILLEGRGDGSLTANLSPTIAPLGTAVLAGGAGVAGVVRAQDDIDFKDGSADAAGTIVEPSWLSVSIGGILGVPLGLTIHEKKVDDVIRGRNANRLAARSAKVRMTSALQVKAEANNVQSASGGYSSATMKHLLEVTGNVICEDDDAAADTIKISLDGWLAGVAIVDSKGNRSFQLRAPKPKFGGVSKIYPGTPMDPRWKQE